MNSNIEIKSKVEMIFSADKNLEQLEIPKLARVDSCVKIPPSKSLTNRALHLASLAKGESCIKNPLRAIDTDTMIKTHSFLGAKIDEKGGDLKIKGHGGVLKQLSPGERLYVSNAGTVARFVTAALSLSDEPYEVWADPAMNERPLGGLTLALEELGVQFDFFKKEHSTPFRLKGSIQKQGTSPTRVTVPGHVSSQFLSALMMVGPFFPSGLEISYDQNIVSFPYIRMTEALMKQFGAPLSHEKEKGLFRILFSGPYKASSYEVEMDYSSASYFLSLAAIHGGRVLLKGAKKQSLQGDSVFPCLLEKMGCKVRWSEEGLSLEGGGNLKPLEISMKGATDLVPALAVTALFAKGRSVLKDVSHMKYKECDRITALCTELSKFGAKVYEKGDDLIIEPKIAYKPSTCATYEDHRMAMALAVAGTKIPGTTILNPSCVAKTFPSFFETLGGCYENG